MSSSCLETIHAQRSSIINHAICYYDIKRNPEEKVGNMGKEDVKEMFFWTKEEYLRSY